MTSAGDCRLRTLDVRETNNQYDHIIGGLVMNVETHSDVWTVAEAKARLSEVIERARREPQEITRHGKSAVVMVDAGLWERIKRREHRGSFADFLRTSPLRGSGLEVERLEGGIREVDL